MTQATTLLRPLDRAGTGSAAQHGLKSVLGPQAWTRLPEAVRERFAASATPVTYAGAFEIVRASPLGLLFAWLGALVGGPVTRREGMDVEARVKVRPTGRGMEWVREYRWADHRPEVVRSTKVVTGDKLIEMLPARLCMPLRTYEEAGVLHFVSEGYYFELRFGPWNLDARIWLPDCLTPGITHVEHIDLGHGWFRFTMAVTHPWFGEMYFQTGRFCAAEDGE